MTLSGEKRETLKVKAIDFIEEIVNLIEGEQLNFEMNLDESTNIRFMKGMKYEDIIC